MRAARTIVAAAAAVDMQALPGDAQLSGHLQSRDLASCYLSFRSIMNCLDYWTADQLRDRVTPAGMVNR
jgi:hypothetical protein